LLEHRTVQAQTLSKRFTVRRQGGLAEHDLDRIAGDKMNQQEDQGHHAEHYGQDKHEPLEEVGTHHKSPLLDPHILQ
jgi:hypothetical protein